MMQILGRRGHQQKHLNNQAPSNQAPFTPIPPAFCVLGVFSVSSVVFCRVIRRFSLRLNSYELAGRYRPWGKFYRLFTQR